jgi:uncharacterized coiled-coil protein SlyX
MHDLLSEQQKQSSAAKQKMEAMTEKLQTMETAMAEQRNYFSFQLAKAEKALSEI